MLAIDNHLRLVHLSQVNGTLPRVLYLNYHAQYSVPTSNTLTGQLLQRIQGHKLVQVFTIDEQQDGWTIPVSQEQIVNFDPDYLIIAASPDKNIEHYINHEPAFAQLSATRNNRIFFVDEAIQQFPSQLIVLAYYDIFQCLKNRNH